MKLINADAIEYTMLYKENWLEGTGYEAQAVWKSDIDKMPTINPPQGYRPLPDGKGWEYYGKPEIRIGRWIEDKELSAKHIEKIYRCSACENFEAWGETEKYNYCPNCGAKMKESF